MTVAAGFKGGFALTFDDDFIDGWFLLRPLFKEYSARATFYICNFDHLNPAQIEKLRQLQADGHEIGSHGFRHRNALQDYPQGQSERYIEEEINPAIAIMQAAGFTPQSFAFPYGAYSTDILTAVQKQFKTVRITTRRRRLKGIIAPAFTANPLFYKPNTGKKVLAGLGIDESYQISAAQIKGCLLRARIQKTVAVFYAHAVVSEPGKEYTVSANRIRTLLSDAQKLGLQSYTAKELPNL